MQKLMLKKNKKGFTLIELIIVIAILAILAALLVPNMIAYINEANESVGNANARTVYSAATAAFAIVLAEGGTVTATDHTITSSSGTSTNTFIANVYSLLGSEFFDTNTSITVTTTANGVSKVTWTDGSQTGSYPVTAAAAP